MSWLNATSKLQRWAPAPALAPWRLLRPAHACFHGRWRKAPDEQEMGATDAGAMPWRRKKSARRRRRRSGRRRRRRLLRLWVPGPVPGAGAEGVAGAIGGGAYGALCLPGHVLSGRRRRRRRRYRRRMCGAYGALY